MASVPAVLFPQKQLDGKIVNLTLLEYIANLNLGTLYHK